MEAKYKHKFEQPLKFPVTGIKATDLKAFSFIYSLDPEFEK